MRTSRLVAAAALAAALVVPAALDVRAQDPAVDFDRGAASVGDIVRQAKASVKQDKAKVQDITGAYTRSERDCAQFVFEPHSPSVSEAVWLRSTEYVEECRYTPGHPDNGGGYRDCWERPRWTYRKKAQVEILNRQPVLPWERERFTVCLDGPWLDFDIDAAAYDYKVQGDNEGRFTLVGGRKIPMDPDPAGIIAGIPANTGRGLSLEFSDRWHGHYAAQPGEQTVLHVELYREVPVWFDPKVAGGDLSFTPAASYKVDFSAFNPKLEPGRKYYVKWGFKRVGRISKSTLMKRGTTDKTEFKHSLLRGFAAR